MKKFKFDNDGRRWDSFRSFHAWNGSIVEFETGEVMVLGHPDPDRRYTYTKFGIQLTTTSESKCPNLYFDKECTEPVKKAWLTWKGQQMLAIDNEQKVAIALSGGWRGRGHPSLGTHVERATAYWAGSERRPVPLTSINIHPPDKEYKKNILKTLQEVQIAVTAVYRMQKDKRHWWDAYKYEAKPEWHDSSAEDIIAEICKDDNDVKRVADKGFKLPRKCEKVDFLYIK